MTCPKCSRGTLEPRSGYSVEPHGERFWEEWLECNHCASKFDTDDLSSSPTKVAPKFCAIGGGYSAIGSRQYCESVVAKNGQGAVYVHSSIVDEIADAIRRLPASDGRIIGLLPLLDRLQD